MIEAKNLVKTYLPKKGVAVHALNDVSLKLPSRGMVFLLGKSGSGKSTLLNVLGGLDAITSGEIFIKGVSAKDFKQSHYDSYRNTYVGFIFQEYNILEEFSVGANIALAIELQGRKPTEKEINDILAKVDLLDYGNRNPNELSGGQKQRVAIARALVKNPEIIMADEPTGALDSQTGRQVLDTLKALSKEKLVLVVSHDREFAETYADRIIELADGKIISDVQRTDTSSPVSDNKAGLEDALSFENDCITVRRGYVLTNDDLERINAYISGLDDDARLVLKGEKRPENNKGSGFVPTDENSIEINKDSSFKLIKSRLSIKNSFKMGASALKHKRFRLIFTIFLSFIAFTLFGLADTIASYDNESTCVTSLLDSGIDYASFQKMIYSDEYWRSGFLLSHEDVNKIKRETGSNVTGVYVSTEESVSVSKQLGDPEGEDVAKLVGTIYSNEFSGFSELSLSDLEGYNYKLLGSKSKMPDGGKNEIAITKYMYEIFEKCGYLQYNEELAKSETVEISTYDDLIGKSLSFGCYGTFEITAIIDTGLDVSRYSSLLEEPVDTSQIILNVALASELESLKEYSMNCVAFVGVGALEGIMNNAKTVGALVGKYCSFYLLSKPKTVTQGDGYTYDTYDFSIYPNRIARLSDFVAGTYYLLDKRTSVGQNEIMIPVENVKYIILAMDNNIFDTATLFGYERDMLEYVKNGVLTTYGISYSNLNELINEQVYKKLSAYKYATENDGAVRNFLNELTGEYAYDSAAIETVLNTYLNSNAYTQDPAFKSYSEAYLNELIERYKLQDLMLSDDILSSLNATAAHQGIEYKLIDDIEIPTVGYFYDKGTYILARKYAYENFDKAKETYFTEHPILSDAPFESIVESYVMNHILSANGQVRDEMLDEIMVPYYEILGQLVAKKEIYLHMYTYYDGYEESKELVKVVGFLESDEIVGITDSLYEKIVGADADGLYSFAIAPMPSNRSGVEKIVKFAYDDSENVKYSLVNSVVFELDLIDEMLDVLGRVFIYIGIALAVFASLMLSNFIATSVALKKQEIGILRAIGSRSNDVFQIFFAEAFIIAMINYALAIVGTAIVTVIINTLLREDVGILITILSFGVRQIVILFLISVGVAFLSTFIPVKKIASKKPIDAIRNR